MSEKSDAELLREYAGQANEAAFREIVIRHADLVYASALRQVRSPELARDISQTVFGYLVRKSPALGQTLTENASLVGWLYRTTRYEANTQMRDNRRRQARERQAMENFDTNSETATEWEQIGPLLDEAMADLSDEDREALLLRFFKNHDFRAIGVTLGVSDDAAQKRVSRALERLRAEFNRRGVTTTPVALSAVVSANAVSAGPAGLAATLSTTALAGTTLTTAAIATKAIAMTTLQKVVIAVALAASVGTGIYEARQALTLRNQNQFLQQQQAPLTDQIQQLIRDRDNTTRQLAVLRDDNERLNRNTAELPRLRGKIGLLQQALASRPQPQNANANWKPGASRRLEEMSDVGQATPEAALQTTIWAALVNPQRLLDLVHLPTPGSTNSEHLERMRQGMINLYTNVDWDLVKEVTIERSDYSKHKRFDLVKDKFGNILQQAGEYDDYVEVYINYPGRDETVTDQESHPNLLPNRWRFTRVAEEWRQVIPGASPDNLSKPADVPTK